MALTKKKAPPSRNPGIEHRAAPPPRAQSRRKRVRAVYEQLQAAHPDAHCELVYQSPFQLLVATVLSAQATDVSVNKATPNLFRRWPTPAALAAAPLSAVEEAIGSIGMFRQKAKNIRRLAAQLEEEHSGSVPKKLSELVALAGVGRKTANVVLGVAFGLAEGVVVDTHVSRISQRLGWAREQGPEKIEQELMALFPQDEWPDLSHTLIFHGRRICNARAPQCLGCPVESSCPSAHHATTVGRKTRPEAAARAPRGRRTAQGLDAGAQHRSPGSIPRPRTAGSKKRATRSAARKSSGK